MMSSLCMQAMVKPSSISMPVKGCLGFSMLLPVALAIATIAWRLSKDCDWGCNSGSSDVVRWGEDGAVPFCGKEANEEDWAGSPTPENGM